MLRRFQICITTETNGCKIFPTKWRWFGTLWSYTVMLWDEIRWWQNGVGPTIQVYIYESIWASNYCSFGFLHTKTDIWDSHLYTKKTKRERVTWHNLEISLSSWDYLFWSLEELDSQWRDGGPDCEPEDQEEDQERRGLALFVRVGHHLGAEGHADAAQVAVG